MGRLDNLFFERKPTLTLEDAAQTIRREGDVISFDYKLMANDTIVFKFVADKREYPPVALNPTVARLLYETLSKHASRFPE